MIILIVFMASVSLASCQQQPAPAPPAPTPTPTPTPPPPATEEPPLSSVKIPPVEVPAGETKQLEVIATDQDGNRLSDVNVTWTMIDKNAGSVTQAGLFTAGEVAMTFSNAVEVQVSKGELVRTATASVTITPGLLEQVVIAPNPAEIGMEMTQQFVAVGADQYGNRISNLAFSWSMENGSGIIDKTGLFTAGTANGTCEDTVKAEVTQGSVTCSATADVTVEPDRILFISGGWGRLDIYIMDDDGSNVKQLTDTSIVEGEFSCSPDGRRIVYDAGGIYGKIMVMSDNGSGKICLSGDDGKIYNHSPDWSPDGSKIAFARDFDIFVMDADGSNLTQLTDTADRGEYSPAWSPDSSKIVFARMECEEFGIDVYTREIYPTEDSDIFVMGADGSNLTQLTDTEDCSEYSPAWSPDGTQILFRSECGHRPSDISVINTDGSGRELLAVDTVFPMWSPDGTQIAFCMAERIFAINADGTNKRELASGDMNFCPAWSPDGGKVVFIRASHSVEWVKGEVVRDDWEIWVMNADGRHRIRLTDNEELQDMRPQWVPRKRGIKVTEDSVVIPGASTLKK